MNGAILSDIQVVSLAINVPGPVAASRLVQLGAKVIKIEPPNGDPLAHYSPAWYSALCTGQQVLQLNLKEPGGKQRLDEMLSTTDLLLTSTRPAALQRLGLDWSTLSQRFPRLCQVAITGYPHPEDNRSGHDLTYQAWLGLVEPPRMPRTLLADLAGAESAVNAALLLLLGRERGQGGGFAAVALAEAAEIFARPLRYGVTHADGPFGGGLPSYNLYRAKDGWIALAALEGHFWMRLNLELGLEPKETQQEDLQRLFLDQTAAYWEAWANERDLPIIAVGEK